MKDFTIGEIFRLGLLLNYDGESYKHKGTVAKLVKQMDYKLVKTKWGEAKTLNQTQIDQLNNRFA